MAGMYGNPHSGKKMKKGGIMGDQDSQYGSGGMGKKKRGGYEDHGTYGGTGKMNSPNYTDPAGNKGGLDNMGSAGYSAGTKGPDRSGRGMYNGDYSGKKRGEMYLQGKEKVGAPQTASIKVGGIASHTIEKNTVEKQSTVKARLNQM